MPGCAEREGGLGACRPTSYHIDCIRVQIKRDGNMIAPICEDGSEREGAFNEHLNHPGNLYLKKNPFAVN